MTKKALLFVLTFIFLSEIAVFSFFMLQNPVFLQDTVAMNEVLWAVQNHQDAAGSHENPTDLDYVVVDEKGRILFRTRNGLSESVNQALMHGDGILDVEADGKILGRILFHNDTARRLQQGYHRMALGLGLLMLLQWVLCIGLYLYLNHILIRPFRKLKAFALHIARGNLDIPLEMDKHNLFGAFTESFDLMRSELKKAKNAEAKAAEDKKELVAKLSHDIRTPLASIKAVSEVGMALAVSRQADFSGPRPDSSQRESMHREALRAEAVRSYEQIISKADQINALVTDLFTATLEELHRLPVVCTDLESSQLRILLENSDYLRRGTIPTIPDCLLHGDKLRLQQVFDNLFSNSYKYAGTEIYISAYLSHRSLSVSIQDSGGGVSSEDLPLLKEKFKRGSNAAGIEGTGLGLSIVKEIINCHGEHINVISTVGVGSEFILSLPMSDRDDEED